MEKEWRGHFYGKRKGLPSLHHFSKKKKKR